MECVFIPQWRERLDSAIKNKEEFTVLHERLDYGNYHFEVLEMNTRRILKVKVIIDPSHSMEMEEGKK